MIDYLSARQLDGSRRASRSRSSLPAASIQPPTSSFVRKHVPDSDPGLFPAPAGDTNHRRSNKDSPGSKENCSAGACPQPGEGGGHRRHLNPSVNQCTQFSNLGVPAPAEGRRRNVGLGLVPSQGRGGGHRRHLNPSVNQCTQFSNLGVPATAGMSDRYENGVTRPQVCLNATGPRFVIRTKACPGLRAGMRLRRFRAHR